jgi:hypothetical protein
MVEIKSFAAACMIVAAGHEPQDVKTAENGVTVWYFPEASRSVASLFQQAKSHLRAIEAKWRATR